MQNTIRPAMMAITATLPTTIPIIAAVDKLLDPVEVFGVFEVVLGLLVPVPVLPNMVVGKLDMLGNVYVGVARASLIIDDGL